MSMPWVLLCGLLCDRLIWEEVAGWLDDTERVTIISFPGYATVEAMADHVLHQAPGRFRLAGHSMGGRVALEVFARSPDRVQGLALLNTGVHQASPHEPESRGRLVKLAVDEGMRRLAGEWLPPMMGAPVKRVAELMPELTRMVERFTPEQFDQQVHALLHRPHAAATLASVDVPTLLLSASNDRWSPLEQHREMLKLVPHASLVAVQDAGHMAPIEAPAIVARALNTLSQAKCEKS